MKMPAWVLLLFGLTVAGIAAALVLSSGGGPGDVLPVRNAGPVPPAPPAGPDDPGPEPAAAPLPPPDARAPAASPGLPAETVRPADLFAGDLAAPPAQAPPIRPLSPEEKKRLDEEAMRQAVEADKAYRQKKIAMFEEFLGDLDETQEKALLETYEGYSVEASREYRRRVTEAIQEARRAGKLDEDAVLPDHKAVQKEFREKAYERLAPVLTPQQMESFRAWWESASSPHRKD